MNDLERSPVLRLLRPLVIGGFLLVAAVPGQGTAAGDAGQRLQLRPTLLRDGLRRDAPGGDLARVAETVVGKEAAKVGLDLAAADDAVLAAAMADDRLFFVFYKVVEEAFGDRAWMIQRIRKVERTWAKADSEPEEKVTWQVEAFKTIAGTLKGSDQHFGSFALRGAWRREIVKEYEIGFGAVPGQADGAAWPFAVDKLFHMLQPYGDAVGIHDAVTFASSRRWSLSVSFTKDSYTITSKELGIDVPRRKLDATATRAAADPASKSIVLTPGVGPKGIEVGVSTPEDVGKVLGEPLEDVPAGPTTRNISYRGGLTCNFDKDGKLVTVITRASFAGKTSNGVSHGSKRAEVRQKLGAPQTGDEQAAVWRYPGLQVTFDALDTVSRIVVGVR